MRVLRYALDTHGRFFFLSRPDLHSGFGTLEQQTGSRGRDLSRRGRSPSSPRPSVRTQNAPPHMKVRCWPSTPALHSVLRGTQPFIREKFHTRPATPRLPEPPSVCAEKLPQGGRARICALRVHDRRVSPGGNRTHLVARCGRRGSSAARCSVDAPQRTWRRVAGVCVLPGRCVAGAAPPTSFADMSVIA